MHIDSPEKESFLQQLFQVSEGNVERQLSMYEIGDCLGLDKSSASALGEELIIDGYVELRSLSGMISITPQGLHALGVSPGAGTGKDFAVLSEEKILTEDDLHILTATIEKTKQYSFGAEQELSQLEVLLIDLKTIEVQLLSPLPKSSIIKAVLASMAEALQQLEAPSASSLAAELEQLIRVEKNP